MRIGPDIIQSISENQVDISSGWAFTSSDAYSPDYKEVLFQPISTEATTLDYLRFKDSVTDIVIRAGYASNSPILWAGQSFNISDTEETSNYHNDLSNIQGGTVEEYYHLTSPQHEFVKNMTTVTKEYTGFFMPNTVGLTYSDVNRTVTLSGQVSAYWRGVQVPFLSAGWVSPAHNAGMTTSQYLYYNGTSIVWSSTPWTFDMLMIALVAIDANGVVQFCIREPHGMMQWESHKELHETLGTYIKATEGGDLSNFTTNSTTNRRPYVSQTIVNDEDIATTLPSLITNQYTLFNLSGTGSVGSYTVNNSDIVLQNANRPFFNQFSGGVWSNVPFANNSYGAIFVLALPSTSDTLSQNKRFVFVQPQVNGSLVTIQALTVSSLNLSNISNLSPEFVFFAKIIIQYTASNWTITQVDKLTGTKVNQSSSNVTGLITVATDGVSVSGLGIPTSPISLVSVGTSGTYTKVITNTKGQVISGSVLTSADIPSLDASKITTGTFDIARIPALPADNVIITTAFSALTSGQQAGIVAGTTVLLSTDGRSFKYSGTGDKTLEGSYIYISDQTPSWTIISDRPITLAGYNISVNDTLFDSKYVNLSTLYNNPSFVNTLDASKLFGILDMGTW